MKKSAFTMIELIIVIVVAGILAVAMMPKLDGDPLRDGANQVVRHIQYAQHLAMVNDVYNAGVDWEKAYWHISFRTDAEKCYIVASDNDLSGGISQTEAAYDPLSKQYLYSSTSCTENVLNNNDLFLNTKYDISTVSLSESCQGGNNYIAFDNFGRPLKTRNASDFITAPCTITLSNGERSAVITVEPETGYTRITAIDDL
ncbi:type II secretion system protein [Sulfurimonas sp. HSL3-7]|uniref:pilus assembly FimT family protein n=1 Tax=Sulfonitrofixus jiaomeiensis TaxID=3131938 RepID=UPI0031F9AC7D